MHEVLIEESALGWKEFELEVIRDLADNWGSTKIIAIAHMMTRLMAIGACSRLAPTAPAMAMAAETPHTAPPAPKVAAKRVEPEPARHPIDHAERDDRHDRCLQDRGRPRPR